MPVSFREEMRDDILILSLHGRLDAIALPELEEQVNGFINAGKIKIVMDFTEVDYLSSAGMRLLLSTVKRLKTLNGRLIVSAVRESLMQIIRLAGFDNILIIVADIESAIVGMN